MDALVVPASISKLSLHQRRSLASVITLPPWMRSVRTPYFGSKSTPRFISR
jgi:hypothetical protein